MPEKRFVVNADAGIKVASDAPQVVESDVEQLVCQVPFPTAAGAFLPLRW